MKILIAGDCSVQDRAERIIWNNSSLTDAFKGVQLLTEQCDYATVNLESPITEADKLIVKDGPTLKNTEQVIEIIKYCGFDTVTLANNHLKDYGCQGVNDTISLCKEKGITIVGAGGNLAEARFQ